MKNKTKNIIGIDAADLCYKRIDGTRIYILNLLEHFGEIAPDALFYIYLKGDLNPDLHFKMFPNYRIVKESFPFLWTQIKLPQMVKKNKPNVLWMPLHNLPMIRPSGMKTVVTIHDLAFKIFPSFFPKRDLFLLNRLTNYAVKKASKIIAVSRSTAKDLTEMYGISPSKVKTIYHGYNEKLFHLPSPEEKNQIGSVKNKYKIPSDAKYLIYVGAIQPRKNLGILVSAFERVKTLQSFKHWKLVLAGSEAWMTEDLKKQIATSTWKKDIIMTGNFAISDLPYLLWGAELFIFPSLYEGFGIPILEAMACGVPVLSAKNSSLIEVGGASAAYFNPRKVDELTTLIRTLASSPEKQAEMREKGLLWVKNFSWKETARKTYELLTEVGMR